MRSHRVCRPRSVEGIGVGQTTETWTRRKVCDRGNRWMPSHAKGQGWKLENGRRYMYCPWLLEMVSRGPGETNVRTRENQTSRRAPGQTVQAERGLVYGMGRARGSYAADVIDGACRDRDHRNSRKQQPGQRHGQHPPSRGHGDENGGCHVVKTNQTAPAGAPAIMMVFGGGRWGHGGYLAG